MSHSEVPALPAKVQRGGPRRISDIWQWLGISGDPLGTSGTRRRNFLYAYAATAVFAGVVNVLNVLTIQHDRPRLGLLEPAIWEGSSWLSLVIGLMCGLMCGLILWMSAPAIG